MVAQGVVQLAHDGGLGQVDDGGGDGVAALRDRKSVV